ncbi:hypothetical protein TI10_11015 [Photorhabdus luminescens subsp. luminescens]|uniref:Uncharacterized protein n=1 Tax=Photorhabdus luminescens TaxID=29488 RepID=A0A1G5QIV9_PHOLU|nr:hypothetical protein TI10_11015 [Photorhabdus luminescens subsp. luminescens]SCZ61744.1 hypothetical protein SAMN02982990_01772 [Photorhabdus luminescens]
MAIQSQDIIRRSATHSFTPAPRIRDHQEEVAKLIDVTTCNSPPIFSIMSALVQIVPANKTKNMPDKMMKWLMNIFDTPQLARNLAKKHHPRWYREIRQKAKQEETDP